MSPRFDVPLPLGAFHGTKLPTWDDTNLLMTFLGSTRVEEGVEKNPEHPLFPFGGVAQRRNIFA